MALGALELLEFDCIAVDGMDMSWCGSLAKHYIIITIIQYIVYRAILIYYIIQYHTICILQTP